MIGAPWHHGAPMPDLVTIRSPGVRARINPFGAELWSLTDPDGREYMTQADPAYWTGHAPLLFPIVGGLAGGRFRLDGAEYALPRHGFARTSAFEGGVVSDGEALFRLTDSAETRAVYPFAFALEMAFRVEGMTLAMTATVRNPGEHPLPFSFGYHPAFAWPLPGGAAKDAHVLTFAQDEPGPVRRLDPAGGLLLPELHPSPVRGRTLPLESALFNDDAVIWEALASRSLTYGAPGGASLEISFPDTPMLGLWQKPGASFICIEPWQGHADPLGFAGELRDKPGTILLAPGDARSFRMDVTVKPG